MAVVVTIIASFSLLIGLGFFLIGAWPVLPFTGLEVLAVALAFHHVHRHAGDYESLTIEGDSLAIEKHDCNHDSRTVFNRYWAQVLLRQRPSGDHALLLRSHSREVEFGRRFLSDEQRLMLARQLRACVGGVT
jgi:uncharacterized membrane protein